MNEPGLIKPYRTLTVRELIMALSKLDPDLPVHSFGEGEENEVISVEVREGDRYIPRRAFIY